MNPQTQKGPATMADHHRWQIESQNVAFAPFGQVESQGLVMLIKLA
jgi:hypothetical protein